MTQKDQIYAQKQSIIDAFEFDEKVAEVFPDMIKRSVPGYSEMVALTGVIANRFATHNSRMYDLGCALGASSLSLLQFVTAKTELVAVDNSESMIKRVQQLLPIADKRCPDTCIDIRHQSIQDTVIKNASVVVLNFVLQFVSPDLRNGVLAQIYAGLNINGALIIAEKIGFDDADLQNQFDAWHRDYKQSNGYSRLEIAQKRTALEKVMLCDSRERLIKRLQSAGFVSTHQWFQGLNFIALVAIKS